MITAQKHDKLITKNIQLITSPIVDLDIIEVIFEDESNLFPNKKLKIKTDNNIILSGILLYDNNKKYLLLDALLQNGDEYTSTAVYVETFEVLEDNENVTISDIKTKLITTKDNYEKDKLVSKGNQGLNEGKHLIKLENVKIQQTYNELISIVNPVLTKIGNINIPEYTNGDTKFKTFEHIFQISGKDFHTKIKITLTNFDDIYTNDNNQFEIDVLEFSTTERYRNIGLLLNLSRKYDLSQQINYLTIDAKFDTSKITTNISGDSYLTNIIIHHVNDVSDIFFENIATSNTVNLEFNTNILNNTVLSNNFIINQNVLRYNNTGVTLISDLPKKINDNDNLNNYKQPGNYYINQNQNISSVLNKPINNNLKFYLEVVNLNVENINNETWLLQRYFCYQLISGNNYQLITFERVSTYVTNVFTWSPWIETGKKIHTHLASDIIENSLKRFVSETDVNNWNSILSSTTLSTWKPSVSNEAALLTTYVSPQQGWNVYVFSTNSIWSYIGTTWINQGQIASDTKNGIITKENYKDYFLGAGISKKVPEKESYIHRLTDNPEDIYGLNYINLNDNHIDKVKRETPLTDTLKQYVIQEGWNVNIYGSNSFVKGKDINSTYDFSNGIGVGLEFASDSQTIIGKYNLPDANLALIIGNGLDDENRNNLLTLSKTGILSAAGFKTPTGAYGDILMANGATALLSDLVDIVLGAVTQSQTEIINVASGNETYILTWDEDLIAKFGRFGKFEVWILVAENIYQKEEVPIQLVTEINSTTSLLTALTYTFSISNFECLILIN
jgi:predicted nuclease of predicted toxin-antitoxin system